MEQKNTLEQRMLEGSKPIVAPNAGVVSYRIDDLEETLNFASIENITTEMLNTLEKQEEL